MRVIIKYLPATQKTRPLYECAIEHKGKRIDYMVARNAKELLKIITILKIKGGVK